MFELIDLTHFLGPSVPTWSGGCGFCLETKLDYPEASLRVQAVRSHAGVGTHVDAPSHFFPEGKNVGEIPLDACFAPLCVLSFPVSEEHPEVFAGKREILAWEEQWGQIPQGSFFALHTGWDRFWPFPEKYRNPEKGGRMRFPGFDRQAAELLIERGVVGLGIDTLSPDGASNGQGADLYPVHQVVLGAGKYILENLTQLEKMPPKGAFFFLGAPKVRFATEYTCRAIGLMPKKGALCV